MTGTPDSEDICTRLERIAEIARNTRGRPLHSLHHHITVEWLREAYRRTRKDGATGVDGGTAAAYGEHLERNLATLLERLRSGTYRAPPVRRVHIPKGDGRTRPIGIPTFEDKVLQRAVTMMLEAVYEQEFYDFSYGFRPGRGAHDALEALEQELRTLGGGTVIEVDIRSFFDTLDKGHLRAFLDERVTDGVLRRAIDKWLSAGVLEDGAVRHPETGTPQGGVISPLLANVYLHKVLDEWFATTVLPRLRGRASLVRYADDFVIALEREDDAERVMAVLPKRFGRYGLTLHPDKTRVIRFQRPRRPPGAPRRAPEGIDRPGSFTFLGLTHYWGPTRRGYWTITRRTASSRFTRAITAIREWCMDNRHLPLAVQQRQLGSKMRGHYAYYGVRGNLPSLWRLAYEVICFWRKALSRRSQKSLVNVEKMKRILARYPLPMPRTSTPATAANSGA